MFAAGHHIYSRYQFIKLSSFQVLSAALRMRAETRPNYNTFRDSTTL